MTDAESPARLRQLFAHAAIAAAAFTFVVIVASALIRHGQSDATAAAVPSLSVRIARIGHRISAAGVLALVVGLNLIAWTQRPRWTTEGALAAIALVLTVGLAAVGIATTSSHVQEVTLGNLLGGFLLFFSLAATAAVATCLEARRSAPLRTLALIGVALVLLDAALAPWSDHRGRSILHAAVGIVVVGITSIVAWRSRTESSLLAVTLALLAAATPLASIVVPLTSPTSAPIVHNACSALLGAALAVAAARPRRDSPS